MAEPLQFKTREDFRRWLVENNQSGKGIWLVFGKSKQIVTLKASEALEEALCFGWIDGLMKKIDDNSYIKYFAARRKNSQWSVRNKKLVDELEKCGMMTDYGRAKIEEAKNNGQWNNATRPSAITEEQIEKVAGLLVGNRQAHTNFQAMSLSVRKTYTGAYLAVKTEAGRMKCVIWMIDRLEKNLKPM